MYASVIAKTSTAYAPWYVVPSDSKWYRNWAIAELLREALSDLKLTYPEPDFDVESCRARLQPPY
jgi:polyphosphate kinase 2 (PPK2 family)